MALWLEAASEFCTVETGNLISRCTDLSGNGNDAVQAIVTEQPSWEDNAVSGHAAIHFQPIPEPGAQDNATSLIVPDAPSLWAGTDDFTWAIVARWANVAASRVVDSAITYSGYGGLVKKVAPMPPYRGMSIFANYPAPFSLNAWTRFAVQIDLDSTVALSFSDGLNDGKFRLYVAWRTGSELWLRIDGLAEGRVRLPSPTNVSALGESLRIGGGRGQPLDGDAAEIVFVVGSSTDFELSSLERHLMRKYGLGVIDVAPSASDGG